ncbi:MAG: hypothetical protein G01um101466_483, partial [Parcubacteria group bacterium Gr01-1014_66]
MLDATLYNELKDSLTKEHKLLIQELNTIALPNPHKKGEWEATFPQFEEVEYGAHGSRDEEADEVEEYE